MVEMKIDTSVKRSVFPKEQAGSCFALDFASFPIAPAFVLRIVPPFPGTSLHLPVFISVAVCD